jgi:hypothetical protein
MREMEEKLNKTNPKWAHNVSLNTGLQVEKTSRATENTLKSTKWRFSSLNHKNLDFLA